MSRFPTGGRGAPRPFVKPPATACSSSSSAPWTPRLRDRGPARDGPAQCGQIRINPGRIPCRGPPRRHYHREDDIFGDGVNIAARLESVAQPGGICISETPIGRYAISSTLIFSRIPANGNSRILRALSGSMNFTPILHLPAKHLRAKSGAARQTFHRRVAVPEHERRCRAGIFCRRHGRGHHHRRCRVQWLFVIARNSSFAYKGQSVNIQAGRPRAGRALRA